MGKKVKALRKQGMIPAVMYGPKAEPGILHVQKKEFAAVYQEAGESSLISLQIGKNQTPVLIRDVQRNPLTGEVTHIDFYQPRLDEKTKIMVPLSFEGEAPAVKELSGTLLQNIHEVEVSAFPQDLPHEIVVPVEGLKTFEDRILVKDLKVDSAVEILAELDWIIAQVVPAEKVEEELAKPVEEGVESVEKVGEGEEAQEGEEGEVKEEKEPAKDTKDKGSKEKES